MVKAIKIDAWTCEPEIVDVSFEIKYMERPDSEWLFVRKNYVTGYESVELDKIKKDIEENNKGGKGFDYWLACAGTPNRYDRLMIPLSEIEKWLEENYNE